MDDLLNTLQTILGGSAGRATKAKDICAAIRQAGNYRWVGLYDVTETEVRNIAWSGPGAPAYPNFPLTRGLSSVAIADKKIVVSNDVASDPRYLTAFSSTGSETIVPIMQPGTGKVIGTLDVESDHVNAFREADRQMLETCGKILGERWV
ncbi:MAG TPA: GAF domain-containing protein [Ktedonobacteraceae bacterium]|nr:GAF domain-containing protein [Ktedonobacteraceae bacterium]